MRPRRRPSQQLVGRQRRRSCQPPAHCDNLHLAWKPHLARTENSRHGHLRRRVVAAGPILPYRSAISRARAFRSRSMSVRNGSVSSAGSNSLIESLDP